MINIVEILHQMKQGATGPYLCSADNDKKYIIKRQRAGFKGCVKEWIFGKLGQSFGLPIPNIELVYIDSSLLQYDENYMFEIGEGIAFASELVPDLQEVTFQMLNSLSVSTLNDLYVFDYWIRNGDRNLTELAGNPNLFYKQSNLDVIVLDHNLAFDEDFSLVDHSQLHVSAESWPKQIDYEKLHNYEERMERAIAQWNDVVTDIPSDWSGNIPGYDEFIKHIKQVLIQYRNQQFWEGLK